MIRQTLFAAALLLAAPAMAQPVDLSGDAAFRATTLTLSSFGEARTAPDQAVINMGVTTQALTAAEALAQNRTRMSAVIAAIRAQGVAERDIQTASLDVSPQYFHGADGRQPPRVTGYQVTNQVAVIVRDLARLGPTLDLVVRSGANQVNGISFGLQDSEARAGEARRQALQNLQRKAEAYAQAAGLRVIRLVNLSESGSYSPRPMAEFARQSFTTADSAASTPVQPGQVQVRVDVTGVYELGR